VNAFEKGFHIGAFLMLLAVVLGFGFGQFLAVWLGR
jgi:hypothetical protein